MLFLIIFYNQNFDLQELFGIILLFSINIYKKNIKANLKNNWNIIIYRYIINIFIRVTILYMQNFIIKVLWEEMEDIKDKYKTLSKELEKSLWIYIDKFNVKNNKEKKYDNLSFFITPTKWVNTIIYSINLSYKTHILLYMPELSNKDIVNIKNKDTQKIEIILEENYNYNEKQIDLFIKLLDQTNITIVNEEVKYNLIWIIWFWINKETKTIIEDNIEKWTIIYDLYKNELIKNI